MPRRLDFSAKALDALEPEARPYRVHDTDDRRLNLQLEVTPTGHKRFLVRHRTRAGKQVQISLGEYGPAPLLSVAAARARAMDHYKANRGGILKQPIKSPVLETFWKTYSDRHLSGLAAKTQRAYKQAYEDHLEPLHGYRLDEIDAQDIARLHADIGYGSGRPMADKARAVLSSLLSHAVLWGYLGTAPVFPPPYGAARGQRWLDRAEVKRLLAALRACPQPYADYFRILLYTGARMAEGAAMRWDQVHLDRALWMRPQKGGTIAPTALASPAVHILRGRPRGSEWVFPATRRKSGHMVNPYDHWRDVCTAAGLRGVRIHDLRHTHASWMAQAGVSLQIIGGQLGHKQTSTTERYAHLSIAAQLAAVEAVVADMEGTA